MWKRYSPGTLTSLESSHFFMQFVSGSWKPLFNRVWPRWTTFEVESELLYNVLNTIKNAELKYHFFSRMSSRMKFIFLDRNWPIIGRNSSFVLWWTRTWVNRGQSVKSKILSRYQFMPSSNFSWRIISFFSIFSYLRNRVNNSSYDRFEMACLTLRRY